MKCFAQAGDPQGNKVKLAAKLSGFELETPVVDDDFLKSKDFNQKSPFRLLPILESTDATVATPNAALKWVARAANSALYTGDAAHLATIDNWLELTAVALEQPLAEWLEPIFGKRPTDLDKVKKAQADVKKFLMTLEARLKTSQYILGDSLTLADVAVAAALVNPFRAVFDEKYRKPLANVTRWFTAFTNLPEVKEVLGVVRFAVVPLEVPAPVVKAAPAPVAKPVAKEAPKKKAEDEDEPKPEKKKNPLDDLPESPFVLDEWKKLYANTTDKASVLPTFFEKYDPQGWSIWYLHYQKAEGEGRVQYMFTNLLDGFLQRMEAMRRYSFGVMGVYGDEPNLEIYAVFVWRGTEVAPAMHEHPSFEYTDHRKLDLNNPEDKALLEEYWTKLSEEDAVQGLKVRVPRVWK
jgi:elongation factor 1-gamma